MTDELAPMLERRRIDPRIKLTRTQTIMQGASHCDFRYESEQEPSS